ncbi:MAG: tyrosine-type recombinase/integrase [Candidatus Berkelbacteria bacterium]|nr:tyrosine-type recombinase/integrase [Candidatus Berkelbacteria bacterium]
MSAREFPALLQAFFAERLQQQRQASPHTVAAYRNTFRLLLRFAATRLRRPPSRLRLGDLDAGFLGQFLAHLQQDRGNSARTRNARLAALHAFFRYVALSEPAQALNCQRVLAIPAQRFQRGVVEYLREDEVSALLQAPDPTTWIGRRDRALLLLAVQTGLRLSELTGLCQQDVTLGRGAHVRCLGKGRKLRCTPLRLDVVRVLQAWLAECPAAADAPVFPTACGSRLSDDAVEQRVRKHAAAAQQRCASLVGRRITPHVLRHTSAMEMLRHGVDRSVIALWLGHESIETTQVYLHADLELKERALARTTPSALAPGRYRPDDALLRFLETL